MIVLADAGLDHKRAFARMRYWLQEIMQDCVLISQDHDRLDTWLDTGSRVLVFPEDPVDQLVGIMLYCKLHAIVQDNLLIDRVTVSSVLDDEVMYHHYADEDQGPFAAPGWWNESRPCWKQAIKKGRGKVIDLGRGPDWKDLDLEWDQECAQNTVVIAEFTRTDHDSK